MKIGIIVAMDKELSRMKALLDEVRENEDGTVEGRIAGKDIVMCGSRIGKVNAAVATYELINRHKPDCIVNTGVAGGLSSDLNPKDVIACTEVVYHDVWCGTPNAYGQVQGLPARFRADAGLLSRIKVRKGLFTSGDYFVTEEADERRILERFPEALSVDMESGAIAQVCFLCKVPFVCIRVVSDVLGKDRESQYDNFWAEVADNSFNTLNQVIAEI